MSNKKKSLYEKFIDNRFKISGIMIIIFGIIGFFIYQMNIKEWILTTDKVFSIWWNIKFWALLLSSYELFNIVTNKNKGISLVGAITIVFSSVVQFNFNNIDALILGIIIICLINKLFEVNKIFQKWICSIAIICLAISYVFTFRPYAISFGYLFLTLIIWILLKNRKELIENKKILINIIITLVLAVIFATICFVLFNNNNIEYAQINEKGISPMFSYLYSVLLPFNEFEGRELLGSFISIFPIPMLISLFYIYKKEDHLEFLFPMSIFMVLGSVFCMSGFPEVINNVTGLSEVINLRFLPAIELANLLVIFYFFSNIEDEMFGIKYAIRFTILSACIIVFLRFPREFSAKGNVYFFAAEISLLVFLFLNYTDKKYRNVFLFFLTIFTLISGVPVNLMF